MITLQNTAAAHGLVRNVSSGEETQCDWTVRGNGSVCRQLGENNMSFHY